MFMEILLKILSIFLLVGIGWFAYKVKLVPQDAIPTLNSFVLNIAVPCLVLQSMQRNEINARIFNDVVWSLAAFAIVTLLLAALATLVINHMKSIPDDDKGIYKVQVAFTNSGFMGYPLTTVIFGQYALFLVIIMNIVFSLLFYSLGAMMVAHKKGEKIFSMRLLGQVLSVPFMSSIVGFIIFISGFHFPSFIDSTLSLMAATVSPVAMFIVGVNLSNSKIREIFTPANLILCAVSLILVPALTMGIDWLLPMSNMVLVAHVFIMAMPSPAVATVFAHRYNKNAKLAAEGVASTTFFSLGTLALWSFFLTEMFL